MHHHSIYRLENFVASLSPSPFTGFLLQSLASCFSLRALPRGVRVRPSLSVTQWMPRSPSCFLSTLSDSLSASHGLSSLPPISFSEPDRNPWLVFRLFFSLSSQRFLPLLPFLFLFSGLLFFLFFPELCLSSILFLPFPGIFPLVVSLSPRFFCRSLLPWLRPWVL